MGITFAIDVKRGEKEVEHDDSGRKRKKRKL